jgi:RNA recognition motif-containing protein
MRTRNHKGNVFVGNLPPNLTDERLAEAFDPFGMVLSAAVARDPTTGVRLRYGFVDIATEKAAKAAINGLNGTQLDGSKLSVQASEKPAKKPGAPGKRPPFGAAQRPPLGAPAAPRMPGELGEAFPAATRRQPSFQVERRPLPRRLTPQ